MSLVAIQKDIARICAAPSSMQVALNEIHDAINAIGGVPRDDYERGLNDAVGLALTIIEAKQAEMA